MTKKKVLGRGLGALMGEVVEEKRGDGVRFFELEVGEIVPNRLQPRKTFGEEALAELSASIKEKGVIEPLIVTRTMAGFELIAGERRLRASKMAGLARVPVVVLDVSDEESLELAVIENIQREDLNPVEEALAYQSLMGFGLSQEEVARRVGKQRATVSNYLRVLKLSSEIRDELVKGEISMGHAKALLSLESDAERRALCRMIISKGLSVREAEKKAARGAVSAGSKTKTSDTGMEAVENDLEKTLGTKVALKERHGRGKIMIEYYSVEERERLLELLLSLR